MNNNKGFTLIELSISIVVVVLFATIVANLNYQIFSNYVEAKRTALATERAVEILEYTGTIDIEQDGFDDNGNINSSSRAFEKIKEKYKTAYLLENTINFNLDNDVYECHIKFEDYANLTENSGKDLQPNILKIITVTVDYSIRGNEENVSIKRVLTKK